MDQMDPMSRSFDYGSINLVYPRIIATETFQQDNLHLVESMKVDDSEYFMKAMEKEITYLTTEGVWEILPKSSLTTSAHIIRLIWRFKRKRNSFAELIKHKYRLFVHGGIQLEGIDFQNTFALIVN